MSTVKSLIKRIPLAVQLHIRIRTITNVILTDELNKGYRGRLLLNYFKWYLYHKPRQQTFEIQLQNGMKSLVYPDSDSGVSSIFTRNVDYHENEYIRSILHKGDFIIDAGCNVGNRTLVLADIISGALLIDANEQCLDRLKRNFALNHLDMTNYHLVAKAVGSTHQVVRFTDLGGTSCQNRIADGAQASDVTTKAAEMTIIDDEMDQLGNPLCAFIKVDLEGYDLDALIGAKKTLSREGVRLVKFERWGSTPLQPFCDFFDAIDWVIFALDRTGCPTYTQPAVTSASNLFAAPKRHMPVRQASSWADVVEFARPRS